MIFSFWKMFEISTVYDIFVNLFYFVFSSFFCYLFCCYSYEEEEYATN